MDTGQNPGPRRLLAVSQFSRLSDNVPRAAEPVTWEELVRRLTRHRERDQQDGELWSPTEYLPGTLRAAENVLALHCFVLDMDAAEHWMPYVERWEALGLTFVIHSTYRHTEEAPRWRAAFPLTEPQPGGADWTPIWERLAWGLARHTADPLCKDAGRMYFLPSHPKGRTDAFTLHRPGEWLDPARFPDPPPPPAPPPRRTPLDIPREQAGRVDGMHLVDRALEIARNGDRRGAVGRHAGCKWLMRQLCDNRFSEGEARSLGDLFVSRCPATDTTGKVAPFELKEMEKLLEWAYSKGAREPWSAPRPNPTPPDALGENERPPPPAEAPQDEAPAQCVGSKSAPNATARVPIGEVGPLAPEEKEVLFGDPQTEDEQYDFSSVYNLAWLQTADEQPPPHVVEDLIPIGVTELYGHAKLGKTFVALGIAVPVALGGIALSRFSCVAGEVLYLAAEDAKWRMKERNGHLLADVRSWPTGFFIDHQFRSRMDGYGLRKLEAWIKARPSTKLIILDPWHAFRKPYPRGADIAAMDYDVFMGLNQLGTKYGCGIIVVHHSSKAGADDDINGGSGSHGISAGAGTIINFKRAREEHTAQMAIRGRDVRKEVTWQLKRDERTGFWGVEGDAGELSANRSRLAIYEALRDNGKMRPKQIAEVTGIGLPTVQWICPRMAVDGELKNDGGTYSPVRRPGTKNGLF